jgi:PncC family amidohydrolase
VTVGVPVSARREIVELVRQVHTRFKEHKLTLSVAESCTGGLICHYVTMLPGASAFFQAGIVSYSADAKMALLGVSHDTISRFGVVSDETVREMAERIRALTRTDYSIASTGNLGPEVLEGKERGLVYVAVAREGALFSRELRLTADRGSNKEQASLMALRMLIEVMDR